MKFYHVKDDYIAHMKKHDSKVPDNKSEHRPYLGVVLEIKGKKFYAPFSSPKKKHLTMKNQKDFRKINQGEYGAINFNNMMPVTDDALIQIDFDSIADEKYKRLLQNQYRYVKSDMAAIKKTAAELYEILMKDEESMTEFEKKLRLRCCNLHILEKAMEGYVSAQNNMIEDDVTQGERRSEE